MATPFPAFCVCDCDSWGTVLLTKAHGRAVVLKWAESKEKAGGSKDRALLLKDAMIDTKLMD